MLKLIAILFICFMFFGLNYLTAPYISTTCHIINYKIIQKINSCHDHNFNRTIYIPYFTLDNGYHLYDNLYGYCIEDKKQCSKTHNYYFSYECAQNWIDETLNKITNNQITCYEDLYTKNIIKGVINKDFFRDQSRNVTIFNYNYGLSITIEKKYYKFIDKYYFDPGPIYLY